MTMPGSDGLRETIDEAVGHFVHSPPIVDAVERAVRAWEAKRAPLGEAARGAMSATWISNIPSLQRALRVEADERSAAIQLVAVAGPGRVAGLMPEVEHRSELFKSEWLTSPRGHSETPMTAALRSVTNDVARGWLA